MSTPTTAGTTDANKTPMAGATGANTVPATGSTPTPRGTGTPVPPTTHSPAATATPQPHAPAGVAAIVGDERIPSWEYHALLALNKDNAGVTSAANDAAIRAQTARQIVDEALLNHYAEARGIAAPSSLVDARLQVYRLQGGRNFARSLARLGVDEARFRQVIARNLNAQAVADMIVNSINAPTVRMQVVQIVVPTQARAQAVADALRAGSDPVLLAARENSDPRLRALAGQLPPLTRSEGDNLYGKSWSAAAFALHPGDVSAPLHVSTGWAVMLAVQRQPAPATMQSALARFLNDLRRGTRIQVYVK